MKRPDVHREVLDNLEDGVLVVELGGRIQTLNPAAERILGLKASEAAGRSFAELFLMREGWDQFTQLLIDAITEQSAMERRVVEVVVAGATRALSAATSYLRHADAGEAVAVIAVFNDITELRELRETELRMAQSVEEQHSRLQDAYREIEERNAELASVLRKVKVVQVLGAVLALGLFLGAGFWTWQPDDLFSSGPAAEAIAGPQENSRQMTVRPRRISSSISLRGILAPWRTVAVPNPVDGIVAAVHFRPGQEVSAGEILVTLDLSLARGDFRRKRLDLSRARKTLRELERWEQSPDMSVARRNFSKAELDLESSRTRINKSRFLFGQGLISASEHEDAERQHRGQLLDFEAAKEELASVRAQGDEDALEEARLEFDAAQQAFEAARRNLQVFGEETDRASVRAPISGVALAEHLPGRGLAEGKPMKKGESLVVIGDFSRLSAVVRVDETDIVRLRRGQHVTVSGNAFLGLRLKGKVSHVSSQANPKLRGAPKFDVAVALDPVAPEEAALLRAGMSARIRIVTYSNPNALLVPIDAVRSRGGTHRLRVLDPATGRIEEREVGTGPTTRDSVEIRAGLKAGETILLPPG